MRVGLDPGKSQFFAALAKRLVETGHTIVGGDGMKADFIIVDEQTRSSRPQLIVQPALFGDGRTHRVVSWNRTGRLGIRPDMAGWRGIRPTMPELRPWKQSNTGTVVIIGEDRRDMIAEQTVYATAHRAWRREISYLPSDRTIRRYGMRRTRPEAYLIQQNAWLTISEQSPAAVQAVVLGIPSVTLSPNSLAHDVTSHSVEERKMPDRVAWAHWLSWQQFSLAEFADGTMMRHMMMAYGEAEADAQQG